jgi:hypothetical protein
MHSNSSLILADLRSYIAMSYLDSADTQSVIDSVNQTNFSADVEAQLKAASRRSYDRSVKRLRRLTERLTRLKNTN